MKIAVTQPRRMAAISMAKRLCFERNVNNKIINNNNRKYWGRI